MPGYAGSSWYFLRYMDPHNTEAFVDRKASDYWNSVDLYIGGTEHAVGHLLYSRMWTKVLYDLGYIGFDEPFKKLLNQGMITGISEKLYKTKGQQNSHFIFWDSENYRDPYAIRPNPNHSGESEYYTWNISSELIEKYNPENIVEVNVPIEFVNDGVVNINEYKKEKEQNTIDCSNNQYEIFLCKDGYYSTKTKQWHDKKTNAIVEALEFSTVQVPEKMSKSKRNVVNPNDIIGKYGADTFRMYEMFLGPVEASKPWDTKGIEGVHRFLRKLWRLFADETKGLIVANEKATDAELKILHKTIKKIEDDTERFSFNTAVSTFMICVNDLHDAKCHKREILEPLIILLVPYAPHIAEELWQEILKNETTVLDATYPKLEEKYLVESSKEYPITINGKVRSNINISLDATQPEVEQLVLQNETVQKWLEGKDPKRIVFVKGKMINVVL